MKDLFDYAKENEESRTRDPVDELRSKQEEILAAVDSYATSTVRDRVAWVLNHYPEARDSDITLQLRYWETFENDVYPGGPIRPEDLYKLTKLSTLERSRRKIQNEYKLFLASPEIREKRGTLAEEEKEKAIEDRPHRPLTTVYMDDSGKTANLLLVAGVWFTFRKDLTTTYRALHDLKDKHKFEREFHFKKLQAAYLPIYKEAIDTILREASSVSFKFITVPRKHSAKGNDAITDLYYHVLVEGLRHDAETGRAPLPRTLQVIVDSEEAALDELRIANLADRLRTASSTQFDGQITVDHVRAASSEQTLYLQVADMFAGTINRIMNRSGTTSNEKDELAEYTLNQLGISTDMAENDRLGDMAVHIKL